MIPCQVCLIKSFQVLKTTIILFCIASKISVVCNSSSKSNSWISGNLPLPVDWSSKLAFLLHFSLIYSWDSLLNSCKILLWTLAQYFSRHCSIILSTGCLCWTGVLVKEPKALIYEELFPGVMVSIYLTATSLNQILVTISLLFVGGSSMQTFG